MDQPATMPQEDLNRFQQPDSIGSSHSTFSFTIPNSNQKIEKKQSTRSIRSPLPQNIARQHSTNNSHHRQYVLLRDKSANLIPLSPKLIADSPKLTPQLQSNATSQSNLQSNTSLSNKTKLHLRKQPSVKYVFSVDDNEDEIEEDLTREYLEGYNDALRQRFKSPNINNQPNDKKKELENEISYSLQQTTKNLKDLKELETDSIHQQFSTENFDLDDKLDNANNTPEQGSSSTMDQNTNDFNNINNNNTDNLKSFNSTIEPEQPDNDYDDNMSISSNESFTLKERQVAINETHPFGIRIWKPAVYKKDRSVQKEAEMDVHAIPGAKPNVGFSVLFFNLIWALTFGLLLSIICYVLGFVTFLFSMFQDPKKDPSIKYAKFYWNLGNYLFYPFGKIVILKTDLNYINEDANVGSTVDEFARWRNQNQGKLFFSSSTNGGGHSNNNQEIQTSSLPSPIGAMKLIRSTGDDNNNNYSSTDSSSSNDEENTTFYKKRYFGRGDWNIGRIVFYLLYYTILVPIGLVISIITWLSIFCIPVSKVLTIMASHIGRHPLALSFENDQYYINQLNNPNYNPNNESFLILTYRSFGSHYYKYTVDGTNIFFINLNVLVLFTIIDFYLFKETFEWNSFIVSSNFIFILCLISIIPLAYFIGQAVASISAQTSMGLGAVINAFFSTIVEIYLYCIALDQSKAKLVEGSLIGSILGGVLLLPGGSMCFGAIKRKTQRYNPASAGVSSTMLIYAIIVMLSPTILYEIYGEYKVVCQACDNLVGEECKNCHYYQPSVVIDPMYIKYLRPFTVVCALSLFLVYCICLLFTLKTHAALIWLNPVTSTKEQNSCKKNELASPIANVNTTSELQSVNSFSLNDQNSTINNASTTNALRPSKASLGTDNNLNQQNPAQPIQPTTVNHAQVSKQNEIVESSSGGHDAPNWSRTKSTTILLTATLLYAIIAEILVDCVDDVLKSISIDPKFLGLTIFALVPNTTEFVNAFSFAMHGNVALSMEIGSAYALQVCLLQIPIVVLYSVYNFTRGYTTNNTEILISKTINNEWNGLPRLSTLLGLSRKVVPPTLNQQQHLQGTVSDVLGFFENVKVQDVLNIGVDRIFSLIFPHWDFIASFLGVYMFTYIYTEGKSNYFKGSILIFLYLVLIIGFYIALQIDSSGIRTVDSLEIISGGRVWNKA